MKILIVEDDSMQAPLLMESLQLAFPSCQLLWIETECQFRERFKDIAHLRPDVIVMDMMLRWTNPAPDLVAPPEEVQAQGYYFAGLRCAQLLAQDRETKTIPVILYSVVDSRDLEQDLRDHNFAQGNVTFLPKDSQPESLIQRIRELVRS